jgi:Heterokaryon incompatibility protein (HET)
MWLLHSRELHFKQFHGSAIPKYAILSHRWEENEVSFKDLQAANASRTGTRDGDFIDPAFVKIQETREQARQYCNWVWIDTCCINKESSAELSEAINSMYRWYKNAVVCFVYMSDVHWNASDIYPQSQRER